MALPLIVLGPILRRVEPRLVSVFVALREPAQVHLTLYEGLVDATRPPAARATGERRTQRFGGRFHAAVVVARMEQGVLPLPPGQRISYDLRFETDAGLTHTLLSSDLLKDRKVAGYGNMPPADAEVEICALGYAENQLPSFVMPPMQLDALVVAHASCRKPHGEGDPAMQYLDAYLDDLSGADAGWIHRLFLTGDQIYADDVSIALLPGLSALGIELVSGDSADRGVEEVPLPSGTAGGVKVNMHELPAGQRQRTVGLAGFSTESGSSHLIGFGDFLAMYCIAWNPDVWPVLAVCNTRFQTMSDHERADIEADAAAAEGFNPPFVLALQPEAHPDLTTPLFRGDQLAHDVLKGLRRPFLKFGSKKLLDAFRREVPKVRRLLANVPTLMIADDHEITDDWFMTGFIRSACTANPLGRAILRNGMAAYAVCQAWGNDPAAWATGPRNELLEAVGDLFGGDWPGGLPQPAAAATIDRLLGLAPGEQPAFDFACTLDGPGHRVRILDTRTRRDYRTPFGAPDLLSPAARAEQLPEETLPDGDVLIVVSPAPVFGPPVMSELGGVLAATVHDISSFARTLDERAREQSMTGLNQGRPLGSEAYDPEHWGASPASFEALLRALARMPRVVVLAGDVHYGGAFAMDWRSRPPGGGAAHHSRIVHFTSSASRNGWDGVVRNLMNLNAMSLGLQRIGLPMVRLGWEESLPPVVDDFGEEPPLARQRVQSGPVLLSDELFRHRHALRRPAEWIWRAEPIVDTRPPESRPEAARVPELAAELPEGAAARGHLAALAKAHGNALGLTAPARGLQFQNNVGLIRFRREADGLHVSQTLLARRARPEPQERAAGTIVHDTRLEPVELPIPDTIGRP